MRLSFKTNVTCRPTRNFWFVNVFSTFRRQSSVVKMAVGRGRWRRGTPSHGTTGTMVSLSGTDAHDCNEIQFSCISRKRRHNNGSLPNPGLRAFQWA